MHIWQIKKGIQFFKTKVIDFNSLPQKIFFKLKTLVPFLPIINLTIEYFASKSALDLKEWKIFNDIYQNATKTQFHNKSLEKKPYGQGMNKGAKYVFSFMLVSILCMVILLPFVLFMNTNDIVKFMHAKGLQKKFSVDKFEFNIEIVNKKSQVIGKLFTGKVILNDTMAMKESEYEYLKELNTKNSIQEIRHIRISKYSDTYLFIPSVNHALFSMQNGNNRYKKSIETELSTLMLGTSLKIRINVITDENPKDSKGKMANNNEYEYSEEHIITRGLSEKLIKVILQRCYEAKSEKIKVWEKFTNVLRLPKIKKKGRKNLEIPEFVDKYRMLTMIN